MSRRTDPLLTIAVCVGVLAVGGLIAGVFILTRPEAKKKERKVPTTLVKTIAAEYGPHPVRVYAMGTVVPAREVTLTPEVSGRVVSLHPQWIAGGLVSAGENLLRMDARDYESLLAQRKAQLAQAERALAAELGNQSVARNEWTLLKKSVGKKDVRKDLVLRVPHLAEAKANLESARAQVAAAALNVERTTLQAPFNALIQQENVDVGQLLSPSTKVATLVGTDHFRVQVAIPLAEVSRIALPDVHGKNGAPVTVRQVTGDGTQIVRPGHVVRLLGDLDPVGRMARVLVEVHDPLHLQVKPSERGLPLLLGAYVHVEIEGHPVPRALALPRQAVRDGSLVWIRRDDNTLDIRPVAIEWAGRELVLIGSGVEEGERIVVSRIPSPVPGMRIKEMDTAAETPAPGDAGHSMPAQTQTSQKETTPQ